MIFGPFTKIHIKEILDLLQIEGKSCEVIEDKSLIPDYQVRSVSSHGVSTNLNDVLFSASFFVDIKSEDLLIVKKLLLDFGFEIKPNLNNLDINFDEKDYICPKCVYSQQSIGQCKNHPEVELVDWLDYERKKNANKAKLYYKLLIKILICFILVFILSWFISQYRN